MVSSQKDSEMLNSDLFRIGNLPYWPMEVAAYDAAGAGLLKLNFPEEAMLKDTAFRLAAKIIYQNQCFDFRSFCPPKPCRICQFYPL